MNFNVTVIASTMSGLNKSASTRPNLLILFMISMLTMHLFAPFVAADGMNTCDNNGGTCDDYNSTNDMTQTQKDWIFQQLNMIDDVIMKLY